MTYEEMNSEQIENELMTKEKELNTCEQANEILQLEDLRLSKEVAELVVKRKNLASGIVQGKNNVRRVRHELKILEILKWKKLREEKGY